jgi:hypothetical protein
VSEQVTFGQLAKFMILVEKRILCREKLQAILEGRFEIIPIEGASEGWYLEIISGSMKGTEIPLSSKRETVVGRGGQADFSLDNDESVSHKHAAFRVEKEAVQVLDEGSTCGTMVSTPEWHDGARRIKKSYRLKEGDQVMLGQTLLKLKKRM